MKDIKKCIPKLVTWIIENEYWKTNYISENHFLIKETAFVTGETPHRVVCLVHKYMRKIYGDEYDLVQDSINPDKNVTNDKYMTWLGVE